MPEITLKTKKAMADRAGISLPTLGKWVSKPGFPKRGPKGWSASAFDRFAAAALADAAKHQTGNDADLKRAKLRKQVELLEIQITAARRTELADSGQFLPIDVARANIMELAAYAKQSILTWPRSVAAMFPGIEATLYRQLEEQAQRVITTIGEKLKLADTDPELKAAADALGILAQKKWDARNATPTEAKQ